jgi:hypothetical protein
MGECPECKGGGKYWTRLPNCGTCGKPPIDWEGIARELAKAIEENIASYGVGAHLFDDALDRFDAAEGDTSRRTRGGEP